MASRPFTDDWGVTSFVFNPASVAAATTAEQTVTIPGLLVGDICIVVKPTAFLAGTGIAGIRVSAANTLSITFINATAGALDPGASETYLLFWFRPEAVAVGSAQA